MHTLSLVQHIPPGRTHLESEQSLLHLALESQCLRVRSSWTAVLEAMNNLTAPCMT